jgi:hypothetical protein
VRAAGRIERRVVENFILAELFEVGVVAVSCYRRVMLIMMELAGADEVFILSSRL